MSERRILDVFNDIAELNDEMHIAEIIDRTAQACGVPREEVINALARKLTKEDDQ